MYIYDKYIEKIKLIQIENGCKSWREWSLYIKKKNRCW